MIPIKDKNNELNIIIESIPNLKKLMTFHEMMDLEDRLLDAKLALRRAQNDTRWRQAVEDLLDDDDVIVSNPTPLNEGKMFENPNLGRMKTTWRQVKAFAEQWSEEE